MLSFSLVTNKTNKIKYSITIVGSSFLGQIDGYMDGVFVGIMLFLYIPNYSYQSTIKIASLDAFLELDDMAVNNACPLD